MRRTVLAVVCAASLSLAACSGSSAGDTIAGTTGPAGSTSPVATWLTANQPHLDTVEMAITQAQWMARHPRHRGLPAACRRVARGIAAARRLPPPPDGLAARALHRELAAFDAAATACLDGRLTSAGHAVNVGHRWAEIGRHRLEHLVGMPVR